MLYNIELVSAIHQHESAIDIHTSPLSLTSLPPPIPSHTSRLSQNTKFELPVSYNKFPLAIHFTYGKVCFHQDFPGGGKAPGKTVKHLPTMQETWVQSLGWEDLLEKEMAAHCSILAWKIPQTEEPEGLQSMGSQRVGHNSATSLSLH